MIKRPSSKDGEEDVLRMQEEYLKSKKERRDFRPAAQVTNIGIKQFLNQTEKKIPKESKFAQARRLNKISELNLQNASGAVTNEKCRESDNINSPELIPALIGKIIEKNTEEMIVSNDFKSKCYAEGFPVVAKHNLHMPTDHGSVFKQNTKTTRDIKETLQIMHSSHLTKETLPEVNVPLYPLVNEIHEENLVTLSRMSEDDILKEKQSLINQLDPSLINFLKSRKRDFNSSIIGKTSNIQDDCKLKVEEQDLWDIDILSNPKISNWLHFDTLEKDKLEWTKGIEENNKTNNEPYEARFDFKGYLLPYTLEYNETNKSLYHHGEEPHRPGYSLSELFTLTRSTVIQQRVMALNTIAGILDYFNTGIYSGIVEIPITKILFIIRFALDENVPVIIETSLKALRNLLYNKIDEAYLDALIGFQEDAQPLLENDKKEIADLEAKESELKDFHLAEIDIITALIRTDIIQRFGYILTTKPSFNSIQYILQILIRLARDSLEISDKILYSDTMECIVRNFIPNTNLNFRFSPNDDYNGKPILPALKLLRILTQQSKDFCNHFLNKHNVDKVLASYISSEVENTYGMKIQIEAFNILGNFLNFELAYDIAVALIPVVTVTLYKHVKGTDIYVKSSIISCRHAAVLINLISQFKFIQTHNLDVFTSQIDGLIKEGLTKWTKQLIASQEYSCGHLKLLAAVFNYFIHGKLSQNNVPHVREQLMNLLNSSMMKTLMENIHLSSNLLSKIETRKIHRQKNIMTFGVAIVDSEQRILPVLNITSPVHFLYSLLTLIFDINCDMMTEIVFKQFENYMQKLIKSEQLYLFDNWFTKTEIELILSFIKLMSRGSQKPEVVIDIVYAVSNRLCYILRSDKQNELMYLFNEIIFNKNWLTSDRLLHLLSLSDANILTTAINNIDEIKKCYLQQICKTQPTISNTILLKQWKEPLLPKDWIYLPIVNLYCKNLNLGAVGENKEMYKEKEFIIRCCLQWIIINETCYDNSISEIDLTDRFCRIMCIYLCDNSLFLDSHIKMLLQKTVALIFKKEKKTSFNFDKELIGIHNFQDFYTQFIEQFQAVSYGDPLFAACLMVPQAQKHNMKWRKLLWSEYAGALRAIDCPEELLCYSINDYLQPEESDQSLIKSYNQALRSNNLRPNSIPHKIAMHHVNFYKLKNH